MTSTGSAATPPAPYWYRLSEVSAAPSEPGLYAWYAVAEAGPAEWQASYRPDGTDAGPENLARFIASHTRRLISPPLRMSVSWFLWGGWQGEVVDSGPKRFAEALESLDAPDYPGRGSKQLHWALHNAPAREALSKVVFDAAPRLTAPIYIGVAENLNERLPQHVKKYNGAREQILQGQSISPKQLKDFGVRAAAAGLRPADLRVGALPITSMASGLTIGEQRKVAEAAEFVLNRWHRPILGRR